MARRTRRPLPSSTPRRRCAARGRCGGPRAPMRCTRHGALYCSAARAKAHARICRLLHHDGAMTVRAVRRHAEAIHPSPSSPSSALHGIHAWSCMRDHHGCHHGLQRPPCVSRVSPVCLPCALGPMSPLPLCFSLCVVRSFLSSCSPPSIHSCVSSLMMCASFSSPAPPSPPPPPLHSLLVIGSRGGGPVKRPSFLGSVSDYCSKYAR